MVNEIPPGHVDNVPVVEPNQHDDVPVVPEPVLVDEDEDPKEEEFEKEEEPQEDKDDMEDSDGLSPGLMRRDINSLFGRMATLSRRLCGRETAHALVEKKGKAKDEYYGKLIFHLGKEVCSSVEQGMTAMEKLVERLGNVKEKAECKKLKKELEEASHEFYQKMIRKGFMFEERPNEAIDVPVKDKERTPNESKKESS
uniref:Uncharacterized protein n=1 Tax=Tanacetum cinerariifolium TaxID=118510 RepID=A0A6L2K5N2_TANCI|nr:hypothetical protein [Tanacetum cinerariifolium]